MDTLKPTSEPAAEDTTAEQGVDISRRAVLKGAAAVAGVAGAQAITGFPLIWAQEIKNIELRHVGVIRGRRSDWHGGLAVLHHIERVACGLGNLLDRFRFFVSDYARSLGRLLNRPARTRSCVS